MSTPTIAEGDRVVCPVAGTLEGADAFTALVVTSIDGPTATVAAIDTDRSWSGVALTALVKVD